MSDDLTVEIDSGVAVLTLNRPEQLNAYTAEMGALLSRAYRECDEDDDVRAIVVTGAGRAFAPAPTSPVTQALSMRPPLTARSRRRRSPRRPSNCANR